jgi:predicted CopG family antitoxin
MGQEPIFKENGRMRQSLLTVDTIITTKIKYPIGEIEFKRIDSTDLFAEKPFSDILKEFYRARKIQSIELFYLFNGTDSSIELHTHGRSLISVEYAQASNMTLKPISFHIRPSCGFGCRDLIIKRGDMLLMQNDFNEQKGSYKTKVQVRVLTLSKKKIFSSYFTTSININSFYLDPLYEKEFGSIKRNITFLN